MTAGCSSETIRLCTREQRGCALERKGLYRDSRIAARRSPCETERVRISVSPRRVDGRDGLPTIARNGENEPYKYSLVIREVVSCAVAIIDVVWLA